MRMSIVIRLTTILLLGLPTYSASQHVDTADANGDGFVSLYELRAAYYADPEFNDRIEKSFERYDRNGDGLISRDELQYRQALTNTATDQAETPATGLVSGKQLNDPAPAPAQETRMVSKVSQNADPEKIQPAGSNRGNRFEQWVDQIDSDRSGGASIAELVASGNGQQWFHKKDFMSADRDDNGELDASELALLVQAQERRQR
ncbi:MAG: hypothetical protein HKM98_03685 [Gammaproteobacteria bacterium]|nr:hypothetical protein [Gammaproteobacteria bacterium]